MFSLVALTLVGIGGWFGIQQMNQATRLIADQKLPAANLLSNIRGQTAAMLQYTLEVSNREKDTDSQDYFKKSLAQKQLAIKTLTEAMTEFEKLELTADEQTAWKEFQLVVNAWLVTDAQANNIIKDLGDNTDPDEGTQVYLFGKFNVHIYEWMQGLETLNKSLTKRLDANLKSGLQARDNSNTAKQLATRFMLTTYGLAIVVSLVLAFFIVNSITRPLEKMRWAIVQVAEVNDFTLRAEVSGRDEAGQTAQAFNELLNKVQQSLQDVLNTAARISQVAGKASATSDRVSGAAVKQSEYAVAAFCPVTHFPVRRTSGHGASLRGRAARRA